MTTTMKLIATASVSALAGAGIASGIWYIVTRGKAEEAVESALEAQRGLYEKYLPKREEKSENNRQNDDEKGGEPASETEAGSAISRATDTHRTDYTKMSKVVTEHGYSSEYPVEDQYKEAPFLIDEGVYSETRLTYDKVEVMYYEPDGVMLDQNQEGFEPMDISRCIGFVNLNAFTNDPDLEEIFVRNDLLSTDYWIVRCRTSISDVDT